MPAAPACAAMQATSRKKAARVCQSRSFRNVIIVGSRKSLLSLRACADGQETGKRAPAQHVTKLLASRAWFTHRFCAFAGVAGTAQQAREQKQDDRWKAAAGTSAALLLDPLAVKLCAAQDRYGPSLEETRPPCHFSLCFSTENISTGESALAAEHAGKQGQMRQDGALRGRRGAR